MGNTVKVKHPEVRLIGPSSITQQVREEIFTVNARGQTTTHTDSEGNLTVYVYYPYNDPEGDGRFVAAGLSSKQYGNVKEVHVDAEPDDVMSLVGSDGDLIDFIPGKITRTNTPGVYQDLVTRFEGSSYDDTTALVGQTTAFDKASNKFYERELHAENRSHLYQPISNGTP